MLHAKQLSGQTQPSWLPRQTHPLLTSLAPAPAERPAGVTTFRQGLGAQRVSSSTGNPERPDPEIPGISKRTGSSRRDPEVLGEVPPTSRPLPQHSGVRLYVPGGRSLDPREHRFPLGVSPHPPGEKEAAGGTGRPAGSWLVELSVATGCQRAGPQLPGAEGARSAQKGDLSWGGVGGGEMRG